MPDAGQVLATRAARMLLAEYDPENDLPENTVGFGGNWGAEYSDAGYTNGGIGVMIDVTRDTIPVDQLLYPVDRPISAAAVRFDTNLAQLTPENLFSASGIGHMEDPVAPDGSEPGYTQYTIGAEFEEAHITTAFEARQRNNEPIRGIIYRGMPISSPNPRVGQSNTNAQTAFEVEALPPDSFEDHALAIFRSIIPAETAGDGDGDGDGGDG